MLSDRIEGVKGSFESPTSQEEDVPYDGQTPLSPPGKRAVTEEINSLLNSIMADTGKIYEELWSVYEPAFSADLTGEGKSDKAIDDLIYPIRGFAKSGTRRRYLEENKAHLRGLAENLRVLPRSIWPKKSNIS